MATSTLNKIVLAIGFSLCLLPKAVADKQELPEIVLYQVGQRGSYCVSISPDASGCISGVKPDGQAVNQLDIFAGSQVRVVNVSDAVHQFVAGGQKNAIDPGPQKPGDPLGVSFNNVDPTKNKITCAIHGDMLGFGYTVPEAAEITMGHKPIEGPEGERASVAARSAFDGLSPTRLFDVSKFILKNGSPEAIKDLLQSRPELASQMPKPEEVAVAAPKKLSDLMEQKMALMIKTGLGNPTVGADGGLKWVKAGSNGGMGAGALGKRVVVADKVGGVNANAAKQNGAGVNGLNGLAGKRDQNTARSVASLYPELTDSLGGGGRAMKQGGFDFSNAQAAARGIASLKVADATRDRPWKWAILALGAATVGGLLFLERASRARATGDRVVVAATAVATALAAEKARRNLTTSLAIPRDPSRV